MMLDFQQLAALLQAYGTLHADLILSISGAFVFVVLAQAFALRLTRKRTVRLLTLEVERLLAGVEHARQERLDERALAEARAEERKRKRADENPFGKTSWNLTAQSRLVRSDPVEAEALAREAGVSIYAERPIPEVLAPELEYGSGYSRDADEHFVPPVGYFPSEDDNREQAGAHRRKHPKMARA